MQILVACEESQAVCKELRELGHEAYSCDVMPCSGGHAEWHIQQDVLPLLDGNCSFKTLDGWEHDCIGSWDMIIAFPPCTHLSKACAYLWDKKQRDGRQQSAIDFFFAIVEAKCPRIAIENPVGIMSTVYRKPDQIIHPWQYGDEEEKPTCLWLKGLPYLRPTKIVSRGKMIVRFDSYGNKKVTSSFIYRTRNMTKSKRGYFRSKTFPGIAKAMAEQWVNQDNYDVQLSFWDLGQKIYV